MDVGDIALPKKNTGLIIGGALAALIVVVGLILAFSGDDGDKKVVTPEPPAPTPTAPAATVPEPAPVEPSKQPETKLAPVAEANVQVTVKSKPDSVEVYSDGAMIGHTPIDLPRPRRGEPALKLTLKADGYKELALSISQYSQPNLTVELDKERRKSNGSTTTKPVEPTKPPEEDKKPTKPKPRTSTEVLDPWG